LEEAEQSKIFGLEKIKIKKLRNLHMIPAAIYFMVCLVCKVKFAKPEAF
jgi:hypothetical protein